MPCCNRQFHGSRREAGNKAWVDSHSFACGDWHSRKAHVVDMTGCKAGDSRKGLAGFGFILRVFVLPGWRRDGLRCQGIRVWSAALLSVHARRILLPGFCRLHRRALDGVRVVADLRRLMLFEFILLWCW